MSEANSTKKCPLCAEEIKFEAIKCKHCGSDLSQLEQHKVIKTQRQEETSKTLIKKETKMSKGLKSCFIIFLIFFFISIVLALTDSGKSTANKEAVNNVADLSTTTENNKEAISLKDTEAGKKQSKIDDINNEIDNLKAELSIKKIDYENLDLSASEYRRLNDLYISNGNFSLDKEAFFRKILQKEINELNAKISADKNKLDALK